MPNQSPYTIVAMYRQSFETVASYGFDKRKLYEEAGIDLDALPAEQHLDPRTWSDKMWRVLTQYISEDEIAFKIMDRFNMGVFGVAGYVILNSPNFITAFANFVRYTHLHTNSYNLRLEQNEQHITLLFERTLPLMYADRFNLEMYVLGFTLNILKVMPGKQFPLEVHYETPPPANFAAYDALFGKNTKFFFNAPANKMIYDAALTHVPVLNANEQLYLLFDKMATDSLQQKTGESAIVRAVKLEISKRIKGALPAIEDVAQALLLSVRSLQLKLKAEHSGYRELLDEVRCDIAISHLRNRTLNISEIAYLLGFSEVSSFSAAFRKWTGKAPSQFV
ncbi:MAG: AraC family transcriptional regulator ligand-binding domain-containing protein [Chitinophagales bacterium]